MKLLGTIIYLTSALYSFEGEFKQDQTADLLNAIGFWAKMQLKKLENNRQNEMK